MPPITAQSKGIADGDGQNAFDQTPDDASRGVEGAGDDAASTAAFTLSKSLRSRRFLSDESTRRFLS